MPLDGLGCTRATMLEAAGIYFPRGYVFLGNPLKLLSFVCVVVYCVTLVLWFFRTLEMSRNGSCCTHACEPTTECVVGEHKLCLALVRLSCCVLILLAEGPLCANRYGVVLKTVYLREKDDFR